MLFLDLYSLKTDRSLFESEKFWGNKVNNFVFVSGHKVGGRSDIAFTNKPTKPNTVRSSYMLH